MTRNNNPVSIEEQATYAHGGGTGTLSGRELVGISREILARSVPFRFSAPGTSMSPFIRDGDVLTLAPYRAGSCRTGTVVAFIRPGPGRLVVHRVVRVTREGCVIKGDNTPKDDGVIPHHVIIGQVIQVEHAGKMVRFGLGPEGRIIALLSRHGWLRPLLNISRSVISAIREPG